MISSSSLREEPHGFSAETFVRDATQALAGQVKDGGFSGAVLGASGGIDSLVVAALCCRASKASGGWPVFALQMADRRVRREHYHPGWYMELGARVVWMDITGEVVATCHRNGLPPYWLTLALAKGVFRGLALPARRKAVTAAMAGRLPRWGMAHYKTLTCLHRVRAEKIREFAARERAMVVVCANRTEASLGYFVEQGIDDAEIGDRAPILGLYKTQVREVARCLELPPPALRQKPSPGFGGILDEEIIGQYALADQVLAGIHSGHSDRSIERRTETGDHDGSGGSGIGMRAYIRFVRALVDLAARKRP